jgi:hypothetical protein
MTGLATVERTFNHRAPRLRRAPRLHRAPRLALPHSTRLLALVIQTLGVALVLEAAGCSARRWDVQLPDNLSDAGTSDRTGGKGSGGRDGTGGQFGNPGGGSGFDAGKDAFFPCGQLALSSRRPTVLLLVDRSANTNPRDQGSNDVSWWRAENEAISGVVSRYGNALKIGYLSFPGNVAGCGTDQIVSWQGTDLEGLLAGCSMGGCVANGPEVPLTAALNDAQNVFGPRVPGQDPHNYAVVLIGSAPTCGACSGTSASADLRSLARLNSSAQTLFIPFGKGLEGNPCLSAFEVAADSKPPLSPTGTAHDKNELANGLQATFKEIASEYLCVFQLKPFAGASFSTLRVQVGNGQSMDVSRDESHQNGWDSDGADNLRIFGPTCQAILDTVSNNRFFVSSATIIDASCGH